MDFIKSWYSKRPNSTESADFLSSIDFDFEKNNYVLVTTMPATRFHYSLMNTIMHDPSPDYCKAMRTCDYLLDVEFENGLKYDQGYNLDVDTLYGPVYVYEIEKVENLKTIDGL